MKILYSFRPSARKLAVVAYAIDSDDQFYDAVWDIVEELCPPGSGDHGVRMDFSLMLLMGGPL